MVVVPCAQCGRELQRPPSRLRKHPLQYCDFRCLGAHRAKPVEVACAVCGRTFAVKASRATQNDAITCGPACLGVLRSRTQIAHRGSAERRVGTCAQCGRPITRKPSHLTKYGANYCGVTCHGLAQRGKGQPINGEWVPCEVCGRDVWRTPASRQPRTFCSKRCSFRGLPHPGLGKPGQRNDASPLWKGGGEYGMGWGDWRSKEIRNRDGNTCRMCGRNRGLVVHHIDFKKFDHSDANLITLCRPCHRAVHNGSLTVS